MRKNAAKGGRPGAARKGGDPLAEKEKDKAKEKEKAEPGSFHYRLKLHTGHDVTLTAAYYPGKPDTSTPVVLLIHEKERSHKDFEDPIAELKNGRLALHLQSLGYAVFSFDLRGHGANRASRSPARLERCSQRFAGGLFILARSSQPRRVEFVEARGDRVGRGGEPGARWAYLPGGAVSHEGRVTDIAALAFVSPLPEFKGASFGTLMTAAPHPGRLAGGRARRAVARRREAHPRDGRTTRANRVELFPSSLHGYKLLRLEPKATAGLLRFLEANVELKAAEWEPRYNLSPITYNDIEVVRHVKPADANKVKAKEKEKEKEKEKDAAREEGSREERGRRAEQGEGGRRGKEVSGTRFFRKSSAEEHSLNTKKK